MSGIRGDSGHTSAGHVVLLSNWPWGEWWERLLRRAARRGGQDGHSEDNGRLDRCDQAVNRNKCSVGATPPCMRTDTQGDALTNVGKSSRIGTRDRDFLIR